MVCPLKGTCDFAYCLALDLFQYSKSSIEDKKGITMEKKWLKCNENVSG